MTMTGPPALLAVPDASDGPVEVARARGRLDVGRLAMVPLAALLLLVNGLRLVEAVRVADAGWTGVVGLLGSVLLLAFYALVVGVYLRRGAARATTTHRPVHVAALVASWLPLALPLLAGEPSGAGVLACADLLVLLGLSCSVLSLRALDRSFSVLPQARALVDGGPYRYVRHPLYLGELCAALGVVLTHPSATGLFAWASLALLLAYRVVHEETVLVAAIPEYAQYRSRTSRLVPGLF